MLVRIGPQRIAQYRNRLTQKFRCNTYFWFTGVSDPENPGMSVPNLCAFIYSKMQQLPTSILGLSQVKILAPNAYKCKMWFRATAEMFLLISPNGNMTIAYTALPE